MALVWSYFCLAVLWLFAVSGPAFNTTLTVQMALLHSRMAAILTTLSITGAVGIWSLAGYWSTAILFAVLPWLGWVFRLAGGLCLLFLGTHILVTTLQRARTTHVYGFRTFSPVQAMALGFFSNLVNPLIPMTTASLFAALPPEGPDAWFGYGGILLIMGATLSWHLFVTGRFGTLSGYARVTALQGWLGRICGLALAAAGSLLLLL